MKMSHAVILTLLLIFCAMKADRKSFYNDVGYGVVVAITTVNKQGVEETRRFDVKYQGYVTIELPFRFIRIAVEFEGSPGHLLCSNVYERPKNNKIKGKDTITSYPEFHMVKSKTPPFCAFLGVTTKTGGK
jgi:cytochrome c oxidase assembly protein Cox11